MLFLKGAFQNTKSFGTATKNTKQRNNSNSLFYGESLQTTENISVMYDSTIMNSYQNLDIFNNTYPQLIHILKLTNQSDFGPILHHSYRHLKIIALLVGDPINFKIRLRKNKGKNYKAGTLMPGDSLCLEGDYIKNVNISFIQASQKSVSFLWVFTHIKNQTENLNSSLEQQVL